jgi:carboxyl-terminal processing protease
MNYLLRKSIAITLIILLALTVTPLSSNVSAEDEHITEQEMKLFLEVYNQLRQYHVDNPSPEMLIDWAIYGMIYSLDDPYTAYLTEKEFEEFMDAIDGTFIGIGVYLAITENGITIQSVIPGGPADKAGMKSGDVITHVDDEELSGTIMEEATKSILGEEGTEVAVTVIRLVQGEPEEMRFNMLREQIILPNVDMQMLSNKVGYLKLHTFGQETYSLTQQYMEKLEKLGMEKLIIDLRGNPGGFLDATLQIASLFKESGVVVNVKDNRGTTTPLSIQDGKKFDLPIVVLIDEGSASASEILSGFLQESADATVVGQQSFGKGTVQRLIPLEQGGVLKVTVEEYFTPNLKQVNHKGITPDVEIPDSTFQLAKAFGLLTKKDELEVTAKGDILLNGLTQSIYKHKGIKVNGSWHIPIRALTDWYDGKVVWNGKSKTIGVTLFDEKEVHIAKKDIVFQEGRSYISVDYINNNLPLQALNNDKAVVIQKQK